MVRPWCWLALLAAAGCDNATETPDPEPYHPAGWASPAAHGLAAKLQQDPCGVCHGADLTGGSSGVGCAECHAESSADWTTDCTFCHGDPAEGSGAPPEDIDDNADAATSSFPAHRAHVRSPLHADWDCTQCHVPPQDIFSEGHFLVGDATAGEAEVVFSGGLAAGAQASSKGCSNVYCHDPRGGGSVSHEASVGCGDCHPVQSTAARWSSLSPPHFDHLREGIVCLDCHPTVDAAGDLADPDRHVDGSIAIELPKGITMSAGVCTGTCHADAHAGRIWVAD